MTSVSDGDCNTADGNKKIKQGGYKFLKTKTAARKGKNDFFKKKKKKKKKRHGGNSI